LQRFRFKEFREPSSLTDNIKRRFGMGMHFHLRKLTAQVLLIARLRASGSFEALKIQLPVYTLCDGANNTLTAANSQQ
jgi:hypothetical protein